MTSDTVFAEEVKARLRAHRESGWYRPVKGARMHEYMVFPTAPKSGFPKATNSRSWVWVNRNGDVGDPKYPINRRNAVKTGYNSSNFKSIDEERTLTDECYGSSLVPDNFKPSVAARSNLLARMALRENLPRTGPLHPS